MERVGPEDHLQACGHPGIDLRAEVGLAGELSTYLGCYGGRRHPGSWYLLSTGAHNASTSRAWLSVSQELHTIFPPLQGGGRGLFMGTRLGPVLQGRASKSEGPLALLPVTKEALLCG